jgi:hypothetical protein
LESGWNKIFGPGNINKAAFKDGCEIIGWEKIIENDIVAFKTRGRSKL